MTRQERRDLIREIWGEQKGSQLVWVGLLLKMLNMAGSC